MAKTNGLIPLPESFAKLIFATQSHLGGAKISNKMKKYVYGQSYSKVSVFDIEQTWEKFILAARAIAGLTNSMSVCAVSGKQFGRKPVLKFAETTNVTPVTGRFVPGFFTNKNVKGGLEPKLLVVSDPTFDKQAVNEAAMVNCPVIGFCNTDVDMVNVDIAIPINNRSSRAIGASFFILSRLVNYIKFGNSLEENIKNVELFFFRDALELESIQKEYNEENKVLFAPNEASETSDYGRGKDDESVEW